MKVAELIERLKEMPQDAEIVMEFMDEIKSIRYHDFGGLCDEKVVQLNMYEKNLTFLKRSAYMKYNDLQDKCKECEHMKPWSLDMGGNHGCMCKKHQLDYFNKSAEKCDEYKHLEED